jgi:hypothetical protein
VSPCDIGELKLGILSGSVWVPVFMYLHAAFVYTARCSVKEIKPSRVVSVLLWVAKVLQ